MTDHLILAFFTSFVAGVLALSFVWVWRGGSARVPRGEKNTSKRVLRWGGAVVVGVFLLALWWDARLVMTRDMMWLFGGVLAFLCVGLWDDRREISWRGQLFWQLIIVSAVVFASKIASCPFFDIWPMDFFWEGVMVYAGMMMAIVWILAIINALNWIDGVDGLAPGVIMIGALVLALISLRPEVMQPPVAIVALSLAGSIGALWLFNIFPARFFLGTAGVYATGFALAYISIFAGAKMATAMLVLAVPLADMVRVIFLRLWRKRALALGDDSHIHYTLIQRGWREIQVSVFLLALTVCAGALALIFSGSEKFLASGVVFLGIVLIFLKVGK